MVISNFRMMGGRVIHCDADTSGRTGLVYANFYGVHCDKDTSGRTGLVQTTPTQKFNKTRWPQGVVKFALLVLLRGNVVIAAQHIRPTIVRIQHGVVAVGLHCSPKFAQVLPQILCHSLCYPQFLSTLIPK